MSKRRFIHVGDITTGTDGLHDGQVVIADTLRLHELRLISNKERSLVKPGNIARQVRDDMRTPFAVAVSTKQSSDSCFYPVFVEMEQDESGMDVIVSIRVHVHPKERERIKAPRIHSKK